MKKLLIILGTITLIVISSTNVVDFCDKKFSTPLIIQDTIYIDEFGEEQKTTKRYLSEINTIAVIQIGFFKNFQKEIQVVKMPKTFEIVPDKLPSEITSLEGMFCGAKSFNQNISNWNTSNVKNMSYMFYGAKKMEGMFALAKSFNENISERETLNQNHYKIKN